MKRTIPTAQQFYFPPTPHDPGIIQQLERDFFGTIRQSNGTYKYTYENRLDDLNDLIARFLPSARPLQIMDVAVSSGISTIEWSQSLDRRAIEHIMTAGDLNIDAQLIAFPGGLKILIDGQSYPLQYDLFGWAVPNPPAKRMLPLVLPGIMLCRLGLMLKLHRTRKWVKRRPVSLVSPRLLATDRITLIEDDILTNRSISDRFHVLRAANILNRDYFDDETLASIASNLLNRLVDGGLFVVCATTDDTYNDHSSPRINDGTVFSVRGADRSIEVVSRIGAGSEVEQIVLGLARP